LKIDYGPGYRVYFGERDSTIVLLLCGGDKSTQDRDIRKAKEYWIEFRSRNDFIGLLKALGLKTEIAVNQGETPDASMLESPSRVESCKA